MDLKRIVLATVFLIFALMLTACGGPTEVATVSAQSGVSSGRSITVVGQGQAFAEPDQAQVNVGVEIFAETVDDATSQNEATIQRIMSALVEQGLAGEDMQTVNYGLWAEQIYGERGPEGIAGYRVTNQISATIRDIAKLGDVLAAVIDAGANSIHGVTFSISEPTQVENEAREAAMADAQQRAESLAQLAALELGQIEIISEIITQPIFPLPGGGGGTMAQATIPSISPGQSSYQVQVEVTFDIE